MVGGWCNRKVDTIHRGSVGPRILHPASYPYIVGLQFTGYDMYITGKPPERSRGVRSRLSDLHLSCLNASIVMI